MLLCMSVLMIWNWFRQKWREMSIGEVCDKLTILQVKQCKIDLSHESSNAIALREQIRTIEKNILKQAMKLPNGMAIDLYCYIAQLLNINYAQWNFEDAVLSATEPLEGLKAAKKSREYNMKRHEIKKKIDVLFNEKYLEIKEYAQNKQI